MVHDLLESSCHFRQTHSFYSLRTAVADEGCHSSACCNLVDAVAAVGDDDVGADAGAMGW